MLQGMAKLRMRDGAKLNYIEVGRGDPVILLHGFAMRGAHWLPFVMRHAHRHRFILPDLRGFGGSHELPLSGERLLDQHADDLHDLITGLGLREVALAGLSMGACTALQYHQRYGFDAVRSYLHIDQGPCVRNGPDWQWGLMGPEQHALLSPWAELMTQMAPWQQRSFGAIPRALRRRFWGALAEFYGAAFHRRGWQQAVNVTRVERVARAAFPVTNWPVYMACLQAYLHNDYDWRHSLRAMDKPMTVVVGMESALYPAEGQLHIADLAPLAQVQRYAGCGHAVPFEAPLRFARTLSGFLAEARQPLAMAPAPELRRAQAA